MNMPQNWDMALVCPEANQRREKGKKEVICRTSGLKGEKGVSHKYFLL